MARSWKGVELDIARLLGGERVPVTGRQRGSAPDVLHPSWAIARIWLTYYRVKKAVLGRV